MGCVHPNKRKYGWNWIPALVGGRWRKTYHVTDFMVPSSSSSDSSEHTQDNDNYNNTSTRVSIHSPMFPLGMHAYILSPRGAKKLLQKCPRASYHVDAVVFGGGDTNNTNNNSSTTDLTILAVHPLIAWQTNADTTIGGHVDAYRKLFPFKKQSPSMIVGDTYTGFELIWGLSAPLFQIPGTDMVLTNGASLFIMMVGIIMASVFRSKTILVLTSIYVLLVAALVRLLISKWNR